MAAAVMVRGHQFLEMLSRQRLPKCLLSQLHDDLFRAGFLLAGHRGVANEYLPAAGRIAHSSVGNPYIPRSERSPDRWFNTSAFAVQPRGTFGNSGRNTVTGPGINNVDASVIKNNRVGERTSVQFRAEFFNVANHPNFDMPNHDVLSPQFGRIFSAQFSRQIQFGLKFIF